MAGVEDDVVQLSHAPTVVTAWRDRSRTTLHVATSVRVDSVDVNLLGPPVRLRPATYDDLAELTEVIDAASRHWIGRATDAAQVRERLDTPGTAIALDTVVAIDPQGSIVGFGHVWPAQPVELRCFARTHPGHTGAGAGTALQAWLIERAIERAATHETPDPVVMTATTSPGDTAGESIMTAFDYAPVRYFMRMIIELSGSKQLTRPLPDGISIRAASSEDDEAIFAAHAESFAEHWGELPPDPVEWWRAHRDSASSGYDPGLWFVAAEGDELIGFAIGRLERDETDREYGYIATLGVRPAWRGRGVAEALLRHSFEAFRTRGLPYAALHVDAENTTGAVRLYTKVGMQPHPSFTIWSRPVRSQDAPDSLRRSEVPPGYPPGPNTQ